jgi:flagellar motor switch protein FliN/FliY
MLREQDTSKTGAAPTTAFRLHDFEGTLAVGASPQPSAGLQTDVTIVLGRTRMTPNEASKLQAGSLVVLEQDVAEPVEIYSGGCLVGRGQVVVIDDKFCVRVVELKAAEQAA